MNGNLLAVQNVVFSVNYYTVLGSMICLMVQGCASPSAVTSETEKMRARKERQQQLERDWRLGHDHGRIGYVGNQAPALEGSTVPPRE
jgi:hypothetical protein